MESADIKRRKRDDEDEGWYQKYVTDIDDPAGLKILLGLTGLLTVIFMVLSLIKIFGSGDFYPLILVIFFTVLFFAFFLTMTLLFLRRNFDPDKFLLPHSEKVSEVLDVALTKYMFKRNYIVTLVVGWIYWAMMMGWWWGYIYSYPNVTGLHFTPSKDSNLFNSFMRLCGATLLFSMIEFYFVIQTLSAMSNANHIIQNYDKKPKISEGKLWFDLFFGFLFILTLLTSAYTLLMYVDNCHEKTFAQFSVWMGLLLGMTGFWIMLFFFYVFRIRNRYNIYQSMYVSTLVFYFGVIFINWCWFMDANARGYGFGDDIPQWNAVPRSYYYFSWRVLTSINTPFFGLSWLIFIPFAFIKATVDDGKWTAWKPTNIKTDWLWWAAFVTGIWILIFAGFMIAGLSNSFYVYIHYETFGAVSSAINGAFSFALIVMAALALWTYYKKGQESAKFVHESYYRFIQLIAVFFSYFFMVIIDWWLTYEKYSAIGKPNTAPAKDVNDQTSVAWNDLMLSAWALTIPPLVMVIILASGHMVVMEGDAKHHLLSQH